MQRFGDLYDFNDIAHSTVDSISVDCKICGICILAVNSCKIKPEMKNLAFFFLSFVLLFSSATLVIAQKSADDNDNSIPERNGDFQDPDHPNLRVRVHVHTPKQKPSPTQSPSLVCNPPDPDSTALTPAAGWHLPSTWTYRLNTYSTPSSVGYSNLSTIANSAFTNWSGAISGKVTFTKGANTTANRARFDGQNIIAWGSTSSGTLAVTYTWYYTATHQAAEEDTIFNQNVSWSWSGNNGGCANSNAYDAQDILTHETGHWMGLDDTYSSAYVNNTMFGYGSRGEIKKDTLTTGDVNGVKTIYP